jgi:N-acetylmuramoyl-L-alanine amidase
LICNTAPVCAGVASKVDWLRCAGAKQRVSARVAQICCGRTGFLGVPALAASLGAPAARAATGAPGAIVFLDPGHNGANDGSINRQVANGRGGTKECQTTRTTTDAG